jgi:hypothetical protein
MRLPAKDGHQQRAEDARAIHERLWLAYQGGSGWLPIETAPKDHEGPPILGWAGAVHFIRRGFTADRSPGWFDVEGWLIHPTHWMPLPSAPTAEPSRITIQSEPGAAGSDLVKLSSNLHRFWGARGFRLRALQLKDRTGFECWLEARKDSHARGADAGSPSDSVPQGRTRG